MFIYLCAKIIHELKIFVQHWKGKFRATRKQTGEKNGGMSANIQGES